MIAALVEALAGSTARRRAKRAHRAHLAHLRRKFGQDSRAYQRALNRWYR